MAESEVARDYAINQGVAAGDIFIEKRSHSTIENVTEAQKIIVEQKFATVLLVSDPLQMRRAVAMLQDLGVGAKSSPTPTSRFRSKDSKLEFLVTEAYKYTVYLLVGR
jgi:uncharacterized SAM-binding protein YcdF (DUF218 family)